MHKTPNDPRNSDGPDDDSSGRRAQAARNVLRVKGLTSEVTGGLRQRAPDLVKRATAQIQRDVSAYAGQPDGKRRDVVHLAVDGAVTYFLDVLENEPSAGAGVHQLFRWMGYAEVRDAHSLDALRASVHIATRCTWDDIRTVSATSPIPPGVFSALVESLFRYVEQLMEQAAIGHLSGCQVSRGGTHDARHRLLTALLSGRPPERLQHHLRAAEWKPPAKVAVATARLDPLRACPALPTFDSTVLASSTRRRVVVVASHSQIRRIGEQLQRTPGIESVAISWEMPFDHVRDGYRWTRRALDLAATGVIETHGVIDCEAHRMTLWLHADPALSRHATAELLGALSDEKPHHRLVLAETMLCWLRARESAPLLAQRMQIHDQTVRRRLKKLKDLLGEDLTDPGMTLPLLSALEVAVPRWRAEARATSSKRSES